MSGCSCTGGVSVTPQMQAEPRADVQPTPTPTPTPTPIPAAAKPQIIGAVAGDIELLDGMLQELSKSSTGSSVLQQAVTAGVRIQFAEDAQIANIAGAGTVASYSSKDNLMYISRTTAREAPVIAAAQLAHESVHFLHDPEIDAAKAAIMAQVGVMTDINAAQAYADKAMAEQSLSTEVEAYMVDARVGLELGLKPSQHFALNTDMSFRTRAQTWQALSQSEAYNPGLLTGLTPQWITKVLPQVQ